MNNIETAVNLEAMHERDLMSIYNCKKLLDIDAQYLVIQEMNKRKLINETKN